MVKFDPLRQKTKVYCAFDTYFSEKYDAHLQIMINKWLNVLLTPQRSCLRIFTFPNLWQLPYSTFKVFCLIFLFKLQNFPKCHSTCFRNVCPKLSFIASMSELVHQNSCLFWVLLICTLFSSLLHLFLCRYNQVFFVCILFSNSFVLFVIVNKYIIRFFKYIYNIGF